MLGVSVYLQDFDEDYIKSAAMIGVKLVFTSLHIPEENYEKVKEKIVNLISICRKYNLQIVPDISPKTFELLGIREGDFQELFDLGVNIVRLDYGFDDFIQVRKISKLFEIVFNASILTESYLIQLEKNNVVMDKISALHNFYPHENTGLSHEEFNSKNHVLRKHNIRIQAFVPGDKKKRFPLYSGLPTIEKHRELPTYVGAVDLLRSCGVSDVFIGDSEATLSSLQAISLFENSNTLLIPSFFYKGYNMDKELHIVRKDSPERLVRLTCERKEGVEQFNNVLRKRGAITMDNYLYGRYSGEVQILNDDFPVDPRVNVIGFVHPHYLGLIDHIESGSSIRFVPLDYFG